MRTRIDVNLVDAAISELPKRSHYKNLKGGMRGQKNYVSVCCGVSHIAATRGQAGCA